MAILRLFFLAALLLSTACKGCEDGALTRVCPGISNPGPLTLTSTDTTDWDDDGFGVCAGDCNDHNRTVKPTGVEICNAMDDDCDGLTDEELLSECWTGPVGVSFDPLSLCSMGVSTCVDGVWGSCENQRFPSPEVCNELDDDCDREIDETIADFCGPSSTLGACHRGDQVCAGVETYCINAVYPQAESCNNVDDDCDGPIDEQLERLCSTVCGDGREICRSGAWVECTAPQPETEICDGLDNDCNGFPDDGIECMCHWSEDPTQRDVKFCLGGSTTCGVGISECQADGTWGQCEPFGPADEQCNNWDDDCDGIVDDFTEPCGDMVHAGHGLCHLGERLCTMGQWDQCDGAVGPTTEICNDEDDDCDDEIDEGLNPHDRADVFFPIDGSGSMCPRVNALRTALAMYADEFRGTEHRFGFGVFPGVAGNIDVITPPVDIDAFLIALSAYDCNYGGLEPGWTAAYMSVSPLDLLGIGWRTPDPILGVEGAFPYVVVIGDETPDQTLPMVPLPLMRATTEDDVAIAANDCQVGSCVPGDRYEMFVLTPAAFFLMWDAPTFFETDRLVELDPADAGRYTEIFRSFLRNVCRR